MISTEQVFADNLNAILKEKNMTKRMLAYYLGLHSSTVTKWTRGEGAPRMDKIDKICELFNITREELLSPRSYSYDDNHEVKGVKIPVMGYVAAGVPLEMITDILDEEEIPASMVKQGQQYFALKIKGDSMNPKISDGDVVICLAQEDVESGQLAIVAVNGDQATCKRIKKYKDGIELIPSNPSHPTRFFTHEEVKKIPVHIIGRVVELRAKFD